jgi:hypothetical protein
LVTVVVVVGIRWSMEAEFEIAVSLHVEGENKRVVEAHREMLAMFIYHNG